MERVEDHELRRHLMDAQDNIIRLIRMVQQNTELITPIKRRAIRHALDSVANLEAAISGNDELPIHILDRKWLRPFLSHTDKEKPSD